MRYTVDSITEYLEEIPIERKKILLKLISMVEEYFPGIKGDMKYHMPHFDEVCAIASQKNYVSVYFLRIDLVDKYRNEFDNLKVGKSCIRFSKMDQLPETTFRKILAEIKDEK